MGKQKRRSASWFAEIECSEEGAGNSVTKKGNLLNGAGGDRRVGEKYEGNISHEGGSEKN